METRLINTTINKGDVKYVIKSFIAQGSKARVFSGIKIKNDKEEKVIIKVYNYNFDFISKDGVIRHHYHDPVEKQKPLNEFHTLKILHAPIADYATIPDPLYKDIGYQVTIMPHLNGQHLQMHDTMTGEDKLHPAIKELNFSDRVNLAFQLVSQNHKLINSKPARIHLDIHGNNILFDEKEKEIHLIDFDSCLAVKEKSFRKLPHLEGNIASIPPEIVTHKKVGVKSPIFSLAPMIMILFGASNPSRMKILGKQKNLFLLSQHSIQKEYESTGLLDNIQIPNFEVSIQKQTTTIPIEKLLKKFIERMAEKNYKDRASPNDTLQFFSALNEIFNPLSTDKHAEKANAAKLILLATGLWNSKCAAFDFKNNEMVCDKIIHCCKDLSFKKIMKFIELSPFYEKPAVVKSRLDLKKALFDIKTTNTMIDFLNCYHEMRNQEGIRFFPCKFNKAEKLSAVNALLSLIEDEKIHHILDWNCEEHFPQKHLLALNNGLLKKIVDKFKDHLPIDFFVAREKASKRELVTDTNHAYSKLRLGAYCR